MTVIKAFTVVSVNTHAVITCHKVRLLTVNSDYIVPNLQSKVNFDEYNDTVKHYINLPKGFDIMDKLTTLENIEAGEWATVQKITLCGSIRRRLMDIGLTPDTRVKCVSISPCGDPHAYLIRGAVIAIRQHDARQILVKKASDCDGVC